MCLTFIYLNSCCGILVFTFYVFIVTVSFFQHLVPLVSLNECTVATLHMTQLPSGVNNWACIIKMHGSLILTCP